MAQLTIQQAFQLALQHHQAGRLQQAEQIYRQILASQPQHVDAMHNLGVLAHQLGRDEIALDLIRRAITIKPNFAEAYSNLGDILKQTGQLDDAIAADRKAVALKPDYAEAYNNLGDALEANGEFVESIAACREALRLRPGFAQALSNLGNALQGNGEFDAAIAAYGNAIALNPNFSQAYGNLGTALEANGQTDDAIAAYRRAITLNPHFSAAHSNLGNALKNKGRFDEAIAACQQAIAIDPNFAHAYGNLASVLRSAGRLDQAIAAARQAIHLDPDFPSAYNNLGNALQDSGKLDDAITAYRKAIALKPDFANAHSNLGLALHDIGQIDEAITAYRVAIALEPDSPGAHSNLGLVLLARQDFQEGWEQYEWRGKCDNFSRRTFDQPQWNGAPLERRTLLLHAEQGYGDTIQFARYLPLVAQRGGKVVCECQPELKPLLLTIDGGCQIACTGDPPPVFDLHCPLMSLPRIFGTTFANVPNNMPYLHPDAREVAKWRELLADYSDSVKIGLAWTGSANNRIDRQRSMKLETFGPLARVPGVRFFSLQKNQADAQGTTIPADFNLVTSTEQRKDFSDTAGLIANLDLVISVDTSVVHLAGAMDKPVWTLLSFAPDWRWFLDRDDTVWYPSMRLFRQRARGDWDDVISRVADALAALRPDRQL
jgi:tetratricopeptide (TPR) repeat protein